jgi:hypothetical protein
MGFLKKEVFPAYLFEIVATKHLSRISFYDAVENSALFQIGTSMNKKELIPFQLC